MPPQLAPSNPGGKRCLPARPATAPATAPRCPRSPRNVTTMGASRGAHRALAGLRAEVGDRVVQETDVVGGAIRCQIAPYVPNLQVQEAGLERGCIGVGVTAVVGPPVH